MINRKISKILVLAFSIIGFMFVMGIMDTPASAEDSIPVNSTYASTTSNTTNAAVTLKDYSLNLNSSETQNGVKVTVTKAIATKNTLKVTLNIDSEKSLDIMRYNDSILTLNYGDDDNSDFTNSSITRINDNSMIVTLEKKASEKDFPKAGEIRVDVVLSKFKVNIGMDIPVDFSNSYDYSIDKDISGVIPELNYTLNKLQSNVLSTKINVTRNKTEVIDRDRDISSGNSIILLKVGNKIYKTHSSGSFSGKDGISNSSYESESVTYDLVKDEKNISLIPLTCNITRDEIRKTYSDIRNQEDNVNKDTTNNVTYNKLLDFNDGTKGEIYNIERSDNTIKVYCKGQSEKESLLLASSLNAYYNNKKEKDNDFYNDDNNMSFYKDPKESLGYIIQFDNVDKDKEIILNFNRLIKQVDKYSLDNEISLLN